MADSLSIAYVSPHAWPPYDDLTWRIAAEADALARRGHRVSVLAPVRGAELVAEGRRALGALREGDADVALAAAGRVKVVPLGRALAGRRRIGGPIDLSATLQDVLSRVPFDVVHVHEPLAPTPALAALRHARGVTAATFHRPEQVSGIAFVRPLVERAIGRLDVLTAASEVVRRAVDEMFDRDATVIPDGVDLRRFAPGRPAGNPPPVVVIGRGADRAGVRFGLGVVRACAADVLGPITVLGTADAHWRTTAAIPKVMRGRVTAVADWGPETRRDAFATGGIALLSAPEDLMGSVAVQAMARGMVVLAPRCPEADTLIEHGVNGIVLAPFSRGAWTAAVAELAADPARRAELGAAAAARVAERDMDVIAGRLDDLYRAARVRLDAPATHDEALIVADLRVRPGTTLTPRQIVDTCAARAIRAVAVIGDRSIDAALEVARGAGPQLNVIVGQQVHTRDGELVGLFLGASVDDGLDAAATVAAIREQGGIVMVPHPVWGEPPAREVLAELRDQVDCYEAVVGPGSTIRAAITVDSARLMQRFGLPVAAGSGATLPDEMGTAHVLMRPFTSAQDFLAALADAQPVQRRRGLRPRTARERRRPGGAAT